MKNKGKAILTIIICLCIGLNFSGCGGNTTDKTEKNVGNSEKINNYTAQQLIDELENNIKFGMSKEELIGVLGKPFQVETDKKTQETIMGYKFILDNMDLQILFLINDNDNMAAISLGLGNGEKYNKYVDVYRNIYTELVNIYGEPTSNYDEIYDDSNTTSYGYDVYNMKSSYGSEWDLSDKIITSDLSGTYKKNGIYFSIIYESKIYPNKLFEQANQEID